MKDLKVYPKHPNLLSAGTLSGNKVTNSRGEDLGKIEDFVVDAGAGRVTYAILSFGGFLGVGDKLFAVPWNTMDLSTEKHAFILDVDKDRLKNAPSFDRSRWTDINNSDWGRDVYSYYGQEPYWAGQGSASGTSPGYMRRDVEGTRGVPVRNVSTASTAAPSGSAGPEVYSSSKPSYAGTPMNLVRASELKDNKVKNRSNEDLGKIEELMIHLDSGKIAYAVLSFGGILGIGNKLFAIPWNALSFNRDRKEFTLDVSKDRLENAPGFDKDNWPDMASPEWAENVHKFYGQTYTGWQR